MFSRLLSHIIEGMKNVQEESVLVSSDPSFSPYIDGLYLYQQDMVKIESVTVSQLFQSPI